MSGLNITDKQIVDATNKMLDEIPDVKKEALLKLKTQGKRLFLLSNTIDMHWDYCVKKLVPYKGYQVDDFFENIFLSQRMHLDKPHPMIFQEVVTVPVNSFRCKDIAFCINVTSKNIKRYFVTTITRCNASFRNVSLRS